MPESFAAFGTAPMSRVCVIGAGSSGLAACQVLHARGIGFDCFEAGSSVGGNWRYDNDNGTSSAYRSLHAKSSRRGMQYSCFPMPHDHPDYLSHRMIARYLDDFADHFGFRPDIRFRTEVTRVAPVAGGGWDVTARNRDTGAARTVRYESVLVANGHHWDPRRPAIPGADGFAGVQLHSHHYRTPEPFAGQRVLVIGIGNSACDIAADCAQAGARTLLAVRRGTHIIPRYLFGMPADRLTRMRLGALAPLWLQRLAVAALVRAAQGPVTRYGLPKPGHRLLCAPPTVSDSLPGLLASGEITVKPGIERFGADRVFFADGSAERVDAVIYATGYRISFPFLSGALTGCGDTEPLLFHRVVPLALPGLYFIGLVQPLGATMPLAEAQAHWVADLIEGRAALPSVTDMHREIAAYRAATAKRYGDSIRHLIQVDFLAYQREIRKERRAGARRAAARRAAARRVVAGRVVAGRAGAGPPATHPAPAGTPRSTVATIIA